MASHESATGILTDDQAREAVMNGGRVQRRRYPPYLLCPLCRGDGSSRRPYAMQCSAAEHPAGWEVVTDPGAFREDRN